MSREAHGRICGVLEVRFHWSPWRLPDLKGETQSGGPTRVRVPMRGMGADQLIVALKSL